MAVKLVFLSLALFMSCAVASMVQETPLLVGTYAEPCGGTEQNCGLVQPEGPGYQIWHGDGSCTNVTLVCALDNVRLVLRSPGHATEVQVTWMGDPTQDPYQIRPRECTSAQVFGSNGFLGAIHTTESVAANFDRAECGTRRDPSKAIPGDVHFYNNAHILEFLTVDGLVNPSVQLLSHTHINVQCCHSTVPQAVFCELNDTHEAPPAGGCTEIQFQLNGTVNPITERFEFSLGLYKNATFQEVLGDPRLGWTLHRCDAGHPTSDEFVTLISTGSGDSLVLNSDLEVEHDKIGTGHGSEVEHDFSTGYFQFDSGPQLAMEQIVVTCTVRIFEI